MRDIRGDLQDRASFLEEQVSASQAQFEKRLEQLNREHQAKIEDLQSELEAVMTLLEHEYRRLRNAPPQNEQPRQAPAVEAERYQTPEQYSRPQEPELQRRPTAEAEHYHRPVPEATYRGRPEQEPYHQPPRAEIEPQRGPAQEAAPYRRPHAAEDEPQRRPAPARPHEDNREPRTAPPQVYRRAPVAPGREQQHPADGASQVPQQPPLADFLVRKLSEIGATTLDELCRLAVQEGYFTDGEIAHRGVHATLMNVVKAGFIRQHPNGTFAPATVMDTIRLRRAI